MGTINSLTTERAAVVAVINPAEHGAGATDSSEVDHSEFGSTQWTLQVGVFGSSFSDITGKSITQLTDGDDNKQVQINLRADELTSGDRYVKAVMTVGTASTFASMTGLGMDARYAPASDNDLSSVDEIVN